jgi:hypothetical protein
MKMQLTLIEQLPLLTMLGDYSLMVGKHSSTTGLTIQMRNYMKELVVRDF